MLKPNALLEYAVFYTLQSKWHCGMIKNIFDACTRRELEQRAMKLTPDTQPMWGKMSVGQMLEHCCRPMEAALSEKAIERGLKEKMIGMLLKGMITSDKPFTKDLPTDKGFLVVETVEFEPARKRMFQLLKQLQETGAASMDGRSHSLLGKLTSEEWNNTLYKHLDHHFNQFGV